MQMRALNVNTAPYRGNGPRKQTAPTKTPAATFISPPRNPSGSAVSTTAAAVPVALTEAASAMPVLNTFVVADAPIVEDFTPEQMLAMAEASYAKCPCETCGAYRTFYAQQVADAQAAQSQTAPTASLDDGDALCPPAELDDDLPSPNAPAGSYYFVPRPVARQSQPQSMSAAPPTPPTQPVPPASMGGGGYQRGSLRQHLGAVPLLAMTRPSATRTAPSPAPTPAAAAPMTMMRGAPMPALFFAGRGPTQPTQPSLSPDPMHVSAMGGALQASRGSGSYTSESLAAPALPSRASGAASASAARHAEAVEQFHQVAPGRVVELACTQDGKALLQAALRARENAVVDIVVPELCAEMDTVALDANACHVLRLTVELCEAAQLIDIVGSFHETLVLNMCTVSQYTRRTLQALMDRQAAASASDDSTEMALDFTPVVEVLAHNAAYLSVTQQGCISLMRVFERCRPAQKVFLMAPLVPSLAVLAFDPFGNYVTQCAVEHSEVATAAEYVLNCFQNQLLRMSCDKFASNVVEKIIRSCSGEPSVRAMLLDELLFNPAALQELVKDSFGNFVVQSIIDSCADAGEMKRICDRLKPVLPSSPYAVRIEGKLKNKRCYTSTNTSTMPIGATATVAAMAPPPHHYQSMASLQPPRVLTSYAPNQMRGPAGKQQWQPPQAQRAVRYANPQSLPNGNPTHQVSYTSAEVY